MLIKSAIAKGNAVYTGRRHHDVILENIDVNLKNGIQGFVDENYKFYDREEAEIYARGCGQLHGELIGSILTSEDLW